MPKVRINHLFSFAFYIAAGLLPVAGSHAGEMLAMNSELRTSPFETSAPLPAVAAGDAASASSTGLSKPSLTLDTDLPQRNLWDRIRGGFGMAELNTPLVARHEHWYANQPDYVARMTERARLYLHFIVREVERRGMPMEIALLPMIESAFNPTAYSVSRASGIWQFIPSTGKHFGMQQNWWYDGRRDVISATNGALDYLQALHDEFGDWELALAAYNCGEHCIERAQARNRKHNRPTDFLSLKLPKETRHYVPKLLAMKHIVANPASFGLVLQDIPNQPYFAAVTPTHHIDVALAAQLAEMPTEEFLALNPGNSRPVILQNDSALILLPADKVDAFESNLELHDKPLVSWQAYQSKKGERLDKLAERFDISIEKLRKANGLSSQTKVANGQKLLVPAKDESAGHEFEAFNMHLAPTIDDSHLVQHVVRRGETLSSIARRYHVSVAALRSWNGNRTMIRPGQRLTIAGGAHRKHTHLAKAGHKSKSAKTGKSTSVSTLGVANKTS
jgi:membrane-bound lytic murein transglycosylase D